ncbi:hypothetical protein KCP75_11325 [Salmonella enterica subsp. enterica]|nr:hypothetical protein KCP75_11325 [Salmonella enterica subsp. enterica]
MQARGFSALTTAILLGMVIRGIPSVHKYGNNATAACCLPETTSAAFGDYRLRLPPCSTYRRRAWATAAL